MCVYVRVRACVRACVSVCACACVCKRERERREQNYILTPMDTYLNIHRKQHCYNVQSTCTCSYVLHYCSYVRTNLATTIPHGHRVVVAGVHPPASGIDPAYLPLVVVHELHGGLGRVLCGRRLREGRHVVEGAWNMGVRECASE